jgi:hypothetical protein
MTALRARQPAVRTPAGERAFSRLQNDNKGPGAHPACHSMGAGVISHRQRSQDTKLTTDIHPVPRLGGVILFFFLSFFLSYSDIFYVLNIGAEDYCCTSTHLETHTETVGLLWISDQPEAEAST